MEPQATRPQPISTRRMARYFREADPLGTPTYRSPLPPVVPRLSTGLRLGRCSRLAINCGDGLPVNPSLPANPATNPANPGSCKISSLDQHWHLPYIQEWNIGVQHAFTSKHVSRPVLCRHPRHKSLWPSRPQRGRPRHDECKQNSGIAALLQSIPVDGDGHRYQQPGFQQLQRLAGDLDAACLARHNQHCGLHVRQRIGYRQYRRWPIRLYQPRLPREMQLRANFLRYPPPVYRSIHLERAWHEDARPTA